MIGIFLAGAFAISLGLFFNRNKVVNYALLFVFSALLVVFSIYEYNHINVVELEFFKPDAIGVLLLFALTIVSIPVIIHGYRYIETHNVDETAKSRAVFFGAMVSLISACSIVLLSGHIAVTWIFIEITTLSASALIYHHRNLRALEGVWKYVFICAISITFVYIGILFLSLSLKDAGIEDMSFDSLYANADKLNPFWLKLSFLFIFTGFTAKLGLVPMYTAGIDAKDKAPAPAGALLSSILMNALNECRIHQYLQGLRDHVAYFASTLGKHRDDYCRFAFDICRDRLYDPDKKHQTDVCLFEYRTHGAGNTWIGCRRNWRICCHIAHCIAYVNQTNFIPAIQPGLLDLSEQEYLRCGKLFQIQ